MVASVIGFDWMSLGDLVALLDEADAAGNTDQALAVWQVIAALRHDELAVTHEIRRWTTERPLDADQRARVAQLCLDYGWRALLEELALAEAPGELRDRMVEVLAVGIAEPAFNDMGEPEALYDSGGGDDDDVDEYEEDA